MMTDEHLVNLLTKVSSLTAERTLLGFDAYEPVDIDILRQSAEHLIHILEVAFSFGATVQNLDNRK